MKKFISFFLKRAFLLLSGASILLSSEGSNSQSASSWKWVHPSPQGNTLLWCKMWDVNTFYAAGYEGTFMKTTNAGLNWYITNEAGKYYGTNNLYRSWVRDAHFFNMNTGILVGSSGGARRTTNGGISFETITDLSTGGISWNHIIFINDLTGYVCGSSAKPYKTNNGGLNWTEITTFPSVNIYDFFTYDGIVLYAAGANGLILKSTDSGANWISIATGSGNSYNRIKFINSTTGIAVGNLGTVYKTSNGGDNWANAGAGFPPTFNFYDVSILENGGNPIIYLTGDPEYIYKSTNSGASWGTLNFKPPSQIYAYRYYISDVIGIDTLLTVGTCGSINLVKSSNIDYLTNLIKMGFNFPNSNVHLYDIWAESMTGKVWAVGEPSVPGSTNDQIMYSSNGGTNWVFQPNPNNTSSITSIGMINGNTGFAVGTQGIVLMTSNGGNNWLQMTSPTAQNLYKVYFKNSSTGWLLGSEGAIFKTTNFGGSWTPQNVADPDTGDLRKIDMNDLDNGWLVTQPFWAGPSSGSKLYKTTNGGDNWDYQFEYFEFFAFDIDMINSSTGYVCGEHINFANPLKKTTNGGVNWFNLPVPFGQTIRSLYFQDENNGIVCADRVYMRTSNGGQNWTYSILPADFRGNDGTGDGNMFMLSPDSGFTAGWLSSIGKFDNSLIPVSSWENSVPKEFKLYQNYPNPFNPSTTIKFDLSKSGKVTLKIYDITGREVSTLINGLLMNIGTVKHVFENHMLASGVYFYSLYVDENRIDTKKMVLIK